MQFTPQQLTGGPRYQHSCRIGNWSEDQELEEIKLKDFLKKKEMGGLLINNKQTKLEKSLEPKALSQSEDGYLRFGYQVMLHCKQTEAFLSVNAHDVVPHDCFAISATTGKDNIPCTRNVFTIERVDDNDGFQDDILHYGQQFRLRMECRTTKSDDSNSIWLHSEPMSALHASKVSRNQEVLMYGKPNGRTIWFCLHPDTREHIVEDGSPVMANTGMLIKHNQTGMYLASDCHVQRNMFGGEFEVHCHNYMSKNKTHNLQSEKKGQITGDFELRHIGTQNNWSIQIAQNRN